MKYFYKFFIGVVFLLFATILYSIVESLYYQSANIEDIRANIKDIEETSDRQLRATSAILDAAGRIEEKLSPAQANFIQEVEDLDIYSFGSSDLTMSYTLLDALALCSIDIETSTTTALRQTEFDRAQCLEHLLFNALSQNIVREPLAIADDIIKIREANISIYNGMYLERKDCFPGCGTMWLGVGTLSHNDHLEEIILEIASSK